MDFLLYFFIFIAICLIYTSIYYYKKYKKLLNTEILLYKLKGVFVHNPNMYPKSDLTKAITIETFLSAINNPEDPFV